MIVPTTFSTPQEYAALKAATETETSSCGCGGSCPSCKDDTCTCCPAGLVEVRDENGDTAGCMTPNDALIYSANIKPCSKDTVKLFKSDGTFYGCVSPDDWTTMYPILNDGGRLKTKRATTGAVTNGSSSLVTVTWDTPFADTNYTTTVSVQDATAAAAALSVVHIESQTAANVVVRIANGAATPVTGTVHAMAVHD